MKENANKTLCLVRPAPRIRTPPKLGYGKVSRKKTPRVTTKQPFKRALVSSKNQHHVTLPNHCRKPAPDDPGVNPS
ncbi:hypothetical protein GWI33_011372 [Rhynchophorus ferrugineus]|uniref:Uncharacterized protein n=1 Tax=Rhynchophorus ferrugineus TaxID=354439 RepID=A0A834MET4_RHYFE|nr:hypothetical protein GWI33_011372 [Rhynchophorus ferrugineus]